MSRLVGLGLALLLAASSAWAAPAAPRVVVDGVAKAIEDRYYDPAKGQAVAADLRAAAARGQFDALTDNRDLATALTDRLGPIDRHFSVRWSPSTSEQGPEPGPRPGPGLRPGPAAGPGPRPPQGRQPTGVRRVEILPGNLGYIDLRMFADFQFGQPDQPARQAVEAALRLVSGADAVIIDLRDNGGGSPAMVGYLTSAFTPKGADIYNVFHHRGGTDSEAPRDWYPTPRLETPLYILISARTGSAAEAFAYTLKNAKRAVIVGEASAGAANPGGPVDVGGGFSVFVSGGSPVNPITKTNWEGVGVAPDVAVPAAAALDAAKALALEAVLKTATGDAATEARWTLEALRAETAPPRSFAAADYVGTYGALVIGEDHGRLFMQRGRRPPAALTPLGGETFSVVGEPSRRVVFERDAKGAVTAFEATTADGAASRFRRGAP